MKIILKKEIDEFLKKDWKFLEKKNNSLIFQKLSWHLSWLSENDKYEDLSIIIVYNNDEPIIIFPFCVVKKFNFKILRWIGYDISDYLGPLVDNEKIIEKKDFKIIWDKIFKLIKNECDLLLLDKQVNEYFFPYNLIIKNLQCKKNKQIYRTDLLRWDETKKSKSKSLQKFRWAKKKLSDIGELKFIEKVDDINEKQKLIEIAIKWKKEKKDKSIFLKSFSEKFYSSIIDDNNLIVSGLKLKNEFIAISLGFINNLNYFYLVPAYKFNSDLAKYSPGKILMIELLNYFENQNFKYFDFCEGQETYKESWANNTIDMISYIKPTNLKGLILSIFLKIKNFK